MNFFFGNVQQKQYYNDKANKIKLTKRSKVFGSQKNFKKVRNDFKQNPTKYANKTFDQITLYTARHWCRSPERFLIDFWSLRHFLCGQLIGKEIE